MTGDTAKLYTEARAAFEPFKAVMSSITEKLQQSADAEADGAIELKMAGHLKHLYRIAEKSMFSIKYPGRADGVLDIVRCALLCRHKTNMAMAYNAVVNDPNVEVLRTKDRWTNPTKANWADFMINFRLKNDPNGHICEVQIIHEKMMMARAGLDAHETYAKLRAAFETIEKLEVDEETAEAGGGGTEGGRG